MLRLLVVAFFLLCASPLLADTAQNIVIEGNKNTKSESIVSVINSVVEPGEITDQQIDKILKALYATQLFSDVKVAVKDDKIFIRVKENALISDVVFEGNYSMGSSSLEKEIQLKPRTILTPSKLREDIRRILDIYHSSGRFNATVDASLVERPDRTNILLFIINEGKKALIDYINFLGNDSFDSDTLRGALFSQPANILNVFGKNAKYDVDVPGYNEELLTNFYMNRGFPDFKVLSSTAELNDDHSGISITFILEEGQRYRIDTVELTSSIEGFTPDDVRGELLTKKGMLFNRSMINADIDMITSKINELGYASVDITPTYTRHEQEGTIDVLLVIKEGPKVYINRVDIVGNKRTVDKVIRREVRLTDGDPFSIAKIRESYRALGALNFFENVGIETMPTDLPDRVNLKIDTKDKKTGDAYLTASFSSQDGITGTVAISERNLMGTGQAASVSIQKSSYGSAFQMGWADPHIFDYNIMASASAFYQTKTKRSYITYDSKMTGFSLGSSMPLTLDMSVGIRYSLNWNNVYNVDPTASEHIKEQEGEYVVSLMEYSLSYSKFTNVEPVRGLLFSFRQGVTGIIGDSHFVRTDYDVRYRIPILERVVLKPWIVTIGFSSGYVTAYQDSVRLNDRFYLGGDDFRGFDYRGVGPRDQKTNDSLGGQYIAKTVLQMDFPLSFASDLVINSLNLRGYTFIDAGTLFGLDNTSYGVLDNNQLRASLGVGVALVLPVIGVPVRLDLAFPVLRTSFDKVKYANVRFTS